MILCENLCKKFGDKVVVSDLNLQVENELFVFLGPNGAGKTTTIKMMTGLLKPTNGFVHLNGLDVHSNDLQAKKQFGYVAEQPYIYEKLTPREFFRFLINVYNVNNDDANHRLLQLAEIFELSDRLDNLIEDFSHGMKQKVAIIGALLHDPKILFLDEPTVGLDPKAAKNLKDMLKGLVEKGTTVFMSTHILEIAERMCDRVAIIKNGKIVALGTIEEIKQNFSSKAVNLEELFLELTETNKESKISDFLYNK